MICKTLIIFINFGYIILISFLSRVNHPVRIRRILVKFVYRTNQKHTENVLGMLKMWSDYLCLRKLRFAIIDSLKCITIFIYGKIGCIWILFDHSNLIAYTKIDNLIDRNQNGSRNLLVRCDTHIFCSDISFICPCLDLFQIGPIFLNVLFMIEGIN